tara:strand:- start:35750 stop:36655 length:906 start_codon:yes stop_codon:yes gene_type:complete
MDNTTPASADIRESFRVYLCHRRATHLTRKAFQSIWNDEHAPLVNEFAAAIGCHKYVQLRMTEHPNPLGAGIAASRHWLAIAIVSLFSGKRPPEHEKDILSHEAREYDVVDELWFESEAALRNAIESPEGRAALKKITGDCADSVLTTSVVAGCGYEFILPVASYPSLKVMFALRRKRDMQREAMQDYWLHKHGPFAQTLKSHLQFHGYEQLHSLADESLGEFAQAFGNNEPTTFDGMASLRYSTELELGELFVHPGFQSANAKLAKDELNFIDGQECIVVFGYQHLVFDKTQPAALASAS